jgi:hypothetical protein
VTFNSAQATPYSARLFSQMVVRSSKAKRLPLVLASSSAQMIQGKRLDKTSLAYKDVANNVSQRVCG